MNDFPVIEHIDQILPCVAGRDDFVVKRKERYTAIDYVYTLPDSFEDPLRMECRGIKFDPQGRLIARPFAKFFNVGERPETAPDAIDVGPPHVVMDKLDGSMIHPALLDGDLVFMTRMGVTDVATRALAFAKDQAQPTLDFCHDCCAEDVTPIFEYTGPNNRVVLNYSKPALTLLALRESRTGRYLPVSAPSGVNVVRHHADPITDLASFLTAVRGLRNAEGYVIRFIESGLMLKLKAEDYLRRHKAKDGLELEKNALRIVLEKRGDDFLPFLSEEDADALSTYSGHVWAAVNRLAQQVDGVLAGAKEAKADRKTFAVEHVPVLPQLLRGIAFSGYQGRDPRDELIAVLVKQARSGNRIDAVRDQISLPRWLDYWHPVAELDTADA